MFEVWWKITEEMNMMKLSGWMRIWIVLSVIFFLSMSWYGLGQRGEDTYRIYSVFYNSCERSNKISPSGQMSCYDYANSQVKASGINSPLEYLLFYSFLPLFLIWVFGFILFKIFNWIKKGFVHKSHNTE